MIRQKLLSLATILCTALVHGQTALTPIWSHVDGSGTRTPTKLALDTASGLLYRALDPDPVNSLLFDVEVFDVDGNDLTPTPQFQIEGSPYAYGTLVNQLRHLDARHDTLFVVMRLFDDSTQQKKYHWTAIYPLNGDPGRLLGSGSTPTLDARHLPEGSLVLTDQHLRTYGPTGLPKERVPAVGCTRMVVAPDRVICGGPPDLKVLRRSDLAMLPDLIVPASGMALSNRMLQKNGIVHYATLFDDNSIGFGAVDTSGTMIWNKNMPLAGMSPELTAIAMDATGAFWISLNTTSGGIAQGMLIGTDASGTLTDVYTYGQTIDDLACSGSRLFCTGVEDIQAQSTYVAALEPGVITGIAADAGTEVLIIPVPATDRITVSGLPADTRCVDLMDQSGRILRQWNTPPRGSLVLDVGDLANGGYLLELRRSDTSIMKRFQIAR